MAHQLLDGFGVAQSLKLTIKEKVTAHIAGGKRAPHLAAILVGENPASQAYVRNKIRACEEVGFQSSLLTYPATLTEAELLQIIEECNTNPDLDGFIVQLPLPKHIDEPTITLAVHPSKDVDGFHPSNLGLMMLGLPSFIPATPLGILKLIEHYNIPTVGKKCVVVGRSNIVGTPMSVLLSRKGYDATVTLTHSRTANLEAEIQAADIVVAAIGIPRFVKSHMVKEGAVVIDVGINRIELEGVSKLVGDVDFDNVAPRCSYITPVPKGVGAMTVVALLLNTLQAYEQ